MNQLSSIGFKQVSLPFLLLFLGSCRVFHILTTFIITGVNIYENNNR